MIAMVGASQLSRPEPQNRRVSLTLKGGFPPLHRPQRPALVAFPGLEAHHALRILVEKDRDSLFFPGNGTHQSERRPGGGRQLLNGCWRSRGHRRRPSGGRKQGALSGGGEGVQRSTPKGIAATVRDRSRGWYIGQFLRVLCGVRRCALPEPKVGLVRRQLLLRSDGSDHER